MPSYSCAPRSLGLLRAALGSRMPPAAVSRSASASSVLRASWPSLQSHPCSREPAFIRPSAIVPLLSHIQTVVVIGLIALLLGSVCDFKLRTSAAAAAADRASLEPSPPPTVRPWPETFGFGRLLPSFVTRAGTEAFVVGAGAEPKVRPAPWKLSSLDCLPQRLPMEAT